MKARQLGSTTSSGRAPLALLLLCALSAIACAALGRAAGGGAATAAPARPAAAEATSTLPPTVLPTATPSAVPTATPAPSETATRTPSPTASLAPPGATVAAAMDEIAQQVAALRGLPILGDNQRFVVARDRAEEVLRQAVLDPALEAELTDQALVLASLGLVKPTYDLLKYALNSNADHIGGFYLPWTKALYVIGSRFGGVERFIFAHEYDHALTDAHFDIDSLGVYPTCAGDAQRCDAIRALVEGDATLLMEQWWLRHATSQDQQDLLDFAPPRQTVPEEFPPPYIVQALAFPYDQGYRFVNYLHQRGGWAEVNQAYANLPQSTEHILHPEKYTAGEAPLAVSLPPLAPALGHGYRLVDNNVLGEWLTYLVLAFGADTAAQLDEAQAARAAAGWGGDRYQVYHDPQSSAVVLAVRWAWDSQRDGEEFAHAMRQYLDDRFHGAQAGRVEGDCWRASAQVTCLFGGGTQTLWLLAPDQATLNNVLAAFPDF